ncbi:RES family NAD+ phosphorylase [Rhodoblastus acidophilus]|uniref:RES family NAD+ phosphorylase n=1 Tax=Rhodoblastus acidophilus TaxID=1074 RepID=UPI002224C9FA
MWTPVVRSFDVRLYEGVGWRLVEAQHKVSTLKLTDDLEEQELLESLIEQTKPDMPAECRTLDYLLATPFRYGAIYPHGSRFRRAGKTPGVFYAAEQPETAMAELAFYRLLFFAESPQTPWPVNPFEFTAFSVALRTERSLDLTAAPLSDERATWTHPTDYSACQALADDARADHIALLRYESVRDPRHGKNLAVLDRAVFAEPRPLERRTWRLKLGPAGAHAICEFPVAKIGFDRAAFAADPRIAGFVWERPGG